MSTFDIVQILMLFKFILPHTVHLNWPVRPTWDYYLPSVFRKNRRGVPVIVYLAH